jgi:hypothetical protein
MKSSIARGKSFLFFLFIVCCFSFNELKSQNCDLCKISSFPSITVYQAFQTGHGMGFGVEAGNWKKDAGKFSYFIGTSLVWNNNSNTKIKTQSPTINQTLLSFYLKGQYQLTSHLYAIAAPGIVNLTYFELQTGLRYVVPLSKVIGIGVEPAYAFSQKQFVVNANMHFALR